MTDVNQSLRQNSARINRKSLTAEQKDFLTKAIGLSKTISEWTKEKAVFTRTNIVESIYSVVVLADLIVESQWGSHPLAQTHYNKRYSNNLALLKADSCWQGKVQRFENKDYKAYQDWLHFATDYSDLLIFSPKYTKILKTADINEQIRRLAATKKDSATYISKVSLLIYFYDLGSL
jgi:flagellum-specific peptidoglycan hydrolase FlgJ